MIHNEALATLDLIVQPARRGDRRSTRRRPRPNRASRWIVGDCADRGVGGEGAASGGLDRRRLAVRRAASRAWRYGSSPTRWPRGSRTATGCWASRLAAHVVIGGDPVVGPRQAAIADPPGGTIVDAESRGAIAAILAALRSHGLIAS